MAHGGWEIDGYTDLEVLGRGGFATVYRARQLAFDRPVALKVLESAATDERTLQLFTRECRAAGALSWHPHVVPVYDAGRTSIGAPYLAMELLTGGSLDDRLAAEGPMAVDAAVGAVLDVADALAAAHEDGLLHRDVKPANVLLDRRGRARLTDFGIARVAGNGSVTSTGVVGTMAFMAPEVLGGRPASPASDVYALGLTLVTLLSGRNPFTAATDDSPFAVITRVMAGSVDTTADVPAPLRALVSSWTSPDPTARPADAATARAALAAVEPSAGAASPPPVEHTAPATPSSAPPAPAGPLVGPVTRAARRIPPPPGSAVAVRPDHTLAVPPPPATPPDERVAVDLSEWPWGLERRLVEHLDAAGIEHEHGDDVISVRVEDEPDLDEAIEVQLAVWAEQQHPVTARDRRLLRAYQQAVGRLDVDSWDIRAVAQVDAAARRIDSMGAPDDVDDVPWRAVTITVAVLDGLLAEADASEDEVRTAARAAAAALATALPVRR